MPVDRLAIGISLALIVALAVAAHGEPPAGADPALAPFFQSLKQPGSGASCCSVADCRPVKTRFSVTGLQAFIGTQFPGGPNEWRDVPEDVIIRGVANQVGVPILCFLGGSVRCYLDGGSS